MDSVSRFITQFKESKLPLHYLICNAGIMFVPQTYTEDGFEKHLAVNYLSHCLFICNMLPILTRTAESCGEKSRIVCVSSIAEQYGHLRLDDIHLKKKYSTHEAYGTSKLVQLMFCYKFCGHINDNESLNKLITFNCLHPGNCKTDMLKSTNLARWFPWFFKKHPLLRVIIILLLLYKTIYEAWTCYLYLALFLWTR